ncbi:MAG TPA: hypothetical protein VGJ05_08865 [Fimbriiglobus sp.]|jgi:hypothetical protein
MPHRSSHSDEIASERTVADATGARKGLACLLVLLGGLLVAAGLVYFLSRVFAGWIAKG